MTSVIAMWTAKVNNYHDSIKGCDKPEDRTPPKLSNVVQQY